MAVSTTNRIGQFENLIGRKVDSIELFLLQRFLRTKIHKRKGMLLLLNAGIFYEFVKVMHFFTKNPRRYTIGEVELGVNYVLIISTNAGLLGIQYRRHCSIYFFKSLTELLYQAESNIIFLLLVSM
jgi:hypothetical protein